MLHSSRSLTRLGLAGLALGLAASLTLGACKKKKETCKPEDYKYKEIALYIQANRDLNLDEEGNPLPTVIRIYQLNGDLATRSLDFTELWEDAKTALGDEYISDKEIQIYPDSAELIKLAPDNGARFILAVAGFQQPVGNTWYRVYEVPDTYGTQACDLKEQEKDPSTLGEPCAYFYLERNQIDGGKDVPPGFDEAKVETVCTPLYTPKTKAVESDDKKDDKKGN
jgi:type VI secretion system VasD/TssJ family lipoprotein